MSSTIAPPLLSWNGKTILLTGVNGYIGSAIGRLLLAKGYRVRGTARRKESVRRLVEGDGNRNGASEAGPFAAAAAEGRFEVVDVPEIVAPGAFDRAVRDVHGIIHTASPVNMSLTSYADVVVPAEQGTTTLLRSALTVAGPQLEIVVVTSSVAAVVDTVLHRNEPGGYVYTEADVAVTALETAERAEIARRSKAGEEEGDVEAQAEVSAGLMYAASKIAAERAVWAFVRENQPPFSVACINPAIVIGPPVLPPLSAESVPASLKPLFDIFTGRTPTIPPTIGSGSVVDLRDVAALHVWALEHPRVVNGERYLAVSGCGASQAYADILRAAYPERRDRIPEGDPGDGYVGFVDGEVQRVEYPAGRFRISGDKARAVMGMEEWIPMKQSVLDTAKVFQRFV